MIIKNISRSSGTGTLIRYIFKEKPISQAAYRRAIDSLRAKEPWDRVTYVAGIRLSKDNIKQLISESKDADLLARLNSFKGTLKEFVDQELMGTYERVPPEMALLARQARAYPDSKQFANDLLYYPKPKLIEKHQEKDKNRITWCAEHSDFASNVGGKNGTHPNDPIADFAETITGKRLEIAYVLAGKSQLNVFEVTSEKLVSDNRNVLLKDLSEKGYDGVRVGRKNESDQNKMSQTSIGLFPSAIEKLVSISLPSQPRLSSFDPEAFYTRAIREKDPFIIRHNLRSPVVDMDSWIKEFKENEKHRIHTSSRQVAVNHTILSWSSADADKLTDEILKDMAEKFIQLRGEGNIYLGTVHREDTHHVHLHIAISATRLDGKSSRLSKQDFEDLKVKMEQYQALTYPQLSNSIINHRKDSCVGKTVEKNIRSERSGRSSLLTELNTTYMKSNSVDDFFAKLVEQGHVPYFRNGKIQGIKQDGIHKHRWTSLGFKEKLEELEAKYKQYDEMRNIRKGRSHAVSKDKLAEQNSVAVNCTGLVVGIVSAMDTRQPDNIKNEQRQESGNTSNTDKEQNGRDSADYQSDGTERDNKGGQAEKEQDEISSIRSTQSHDNTLDLDDVR